MEINLSLSQIFIRLVIASLIGGIIGFERETKGKDAGIRTHTLVSLGSCIITLSQLEISNWVIEFTLSNPEHINILSSDLTRMTAQVINGIGFLGAGTILVNKDSLTGLTTAASIWVVASIGIAVGMGHYYISFFSLLIVLVVLILVRKILNPGSIKNIYIEYTDFDETTYQIYQILEKFKVTILSLELRISDNHGRQSNMTKITVIIPKRQITSYIISEISSLNHIKMVSTVLDFS